MNRDILDRRRAERFAQLLDETTGGPRHHTRARDDEQLADLVTVGHALSRIRPTANLDPEFRSSLRAMLLATAERDGIGATATDDGHGAHAAEREPRRRPLLFGAGRRIRARGAIVIGVAAGALAVSGMSAASENAVPGDALYGVKRSTEQLQAALAGSDVTQGMLRLDFARNRLIEMGAVDLGGAGLAGVLSDMDTDTVQGVRLLTTAAMQRKEEAPLNAVDTFVRDQRRQIGTLLDRMGPANRERALRSMSLLDDVDRRVRALRNGLECGYDRSVGSDQLGPKPHPACWAAPGRSGGPSSGAGQPDGRSSVGRPGARPENDSRSATPQPSKTGTGAKGSGGQRGTAPDPSGAASPEPSPTPPDTDEGVLDGIFDGLLG